MNKKGAALILIFFIIAALTILSTAMLSKSISENYLAKRYKESTQAFWLAEAAIQKALWQLNYGGGDWSGWDENENGDKILSSYPLGNIGEFSVTISGLSGNQPTITASGCIPTVAASKISRSIEAKIGEQTLPLFTSAGFGKSSLTMTGNGKTDSYDSSKGPYGGSNKGSNGDVGTNGTTAGAISLSGNATVNGDASTGGGGTVSINGNAKVTGEITDDSNKELPSVNVPTSLTGLGSGGSYSVGGNGKKTITSGDYKYSSVSISGNGKLYIDGEVRIYATSSSALTISGNGKIILKEGAKLTFYTDGKAQIGGNGIVNNTSLPENFLLYSTYSGSEGVKITGNGDLYGAIYAPDSEVKISGNGDIFGSVVGDQVKVTGNGDIHYDEALANITTSSGNYAIQIWQDKENPYPLGS